MPPKFSKNTLNFEYYKRVNTDNTPFKLILYLYKNSLNLLIEDPNTSKMYLTDQYDLQKFIKVKEIETPWIKTIDGSYIKYTTKEIYQVLPIFNNTNFINLEIEIPLNEKERNRVRKLNEKHFKITEGKTGSIRISASFPMWNVWGLVQNNKDSDLYSLQKTFIKFKNKFYKFPYGNVNDENRVCLGSGTTLFENVKQLWHNYILTIFNRDYGFNIRSHKLFEISRITRRKIERFISPTFDLEHINILIQLKRFDKISLIDMMYYLSNLELIDDDSISELFFKITKMPWEKKI